MYAVTWETIKHEIDKLDEDDKSVLLLGLFKKATNKPDKIYDMLQKINAERTTNHPSSGQPQNS